LPELSKSGDLFKVTHDFKGGPRLIQTVPITLTWSEVTIPDFEKFAIYRAALGGVKDVWIERIKITNPLQVTFTDTIDDDQTFQYKVRIEDKSGNFRETYTDPIVLRTTHILVPDEYQSLQEAYNSPFIDNGDTIYVNPKTYTWPFKFIGKDVYIKSVAGKEETILRRGRTVVSMNRGILSGFTIKQGTVRLFGTARMEDCIVTEVHTIDESFSGGVVERAGVVVSDTAEVRNCIISHNRKYLFNWYGGNGAGVILRDFATLRNCRITKNRADMYGGGISVFGQPRIINCIIDNNYAIGWRGGGGGIYLNPNSKLTVVNSVLYNNRTNRRDGGFGAVFGGEYSLNIVNSIVWANSKQENENKVWINASYCDIQGYSGGTGNRSSPPNFVDPASGDFHLLPESLCIDVGDPAQEYNDPDGSRNDLGAFGGPYGDW